MAKHLDTLAILFYVWGAFEIVLGLAVVGLYILGGVGIGAAGIIEGDGGLMLTGGFMSLAGIVTGVFFTVFSLPAFFAASGIRRRKTWGRILGFVVGALALTSFPLGTALGVFAFVVLIDKEAAAEFEAS